MKQMFQTTVIYLRIPTGRRLGCNQSVERLTAGLPNRIPASCREVDSSALTTGFITLALACSHFVRLLLKAKRDCSHTKHHCVKYIGDSVE